jgi:ankyrin repeat protein
MGPPLYDAARTGKTDVVRRLLKQGADVNLGLETGWTPLHAACYYNKPSIARLLLEFNPNLETPITHDGYRPLHKAAESGSVEVVKLLVDNGADIEARSNGLATPLWVAANRNRRSAVRFLLDQKAQIEAADKFNNTPLHGAVNAGHCQLVRELLADGAKYDTQNNAGKTPLYSAAQSGREDVLRCLLEQGADPTIVTVEGWTALHTAAYQGHTRVAEILIQDRRIGLDDGTYAYGYTPLHKAVESDSVQMVRLILNGGANINSLTSENWTPLHLAARLNRLWAVEELLRRGSRVNSVTRKNWSPLHVAISNGHKDVIRLLLKYREKLDLDLRTSEGDTALSMAQAKSYQDVVEWLSNPLTIDMKQTSVGDITGSTMAHNRYVHAVGRAYSLGSLLRV